MKAIKILGHPITVICLFFVILISGESIGGVYLFYLLLALPHGLVHSLLAILGIGLLTLSYSQLKTKQNVAMKLINVVGILLLLLSILTFFYNDKGHYNYGSFSSAAFWITSGLFVLSTLFHLLITLTPFGKINHRRKLNLV